MDLDTICMEDCVTLSCFYCDLRGRIKAVARTLISRIVDAFNMTNIERSIKELLNQHQYRTHSVDKNGSVEALEARDDCSVESVEARDG